MKFYAIKHDDDFIYSYYHNEYIPMLFETVESAEGDGNG